MFIKSLHPKVNLTVGWFFRSKSGKLTKIHSSKRLNYWSEYMGCAEFLQNNNHNKTTNWQLLNVIITKCNKNSAAERESVNTSNHHFKSRRFFVVDWPSIPYKNDHSERLPTDIEYGLNDWTDWQRREFCRVIIQICHPDTLSWATKIVLFTQFVYMRSRKAIGKFRMIKIRIWLRG